MEGSKRSYDALKQSLFTATTRGVKNTSLITNNKTCMNAAKGIGPDSFSYPDKSANINPEMNVKPPDIKTKPIPEIKT